MQFTSYFCEYSKLFFYFVFKISQPPKGLQARRSVTVTFHVVVYQPVWDWDDSTKMYIRFGHPDLDVWKYDFGPLRVERYDHRPSGLYTFLKG